MKNKKDSKKSAKKISKKMLSDNEDYEIES